MRGKLVVGLLVCLAGALAAQPAGPEYPLTYGKGRGQVAGSTDRMLGPLRESLRDVLPGDPNPMVDLLEDQYFAAFDVGYMVGALAAMCQLKGIPDRECRDLLVDLP